MTTLRRRSVRTPAYRRKNGMIPLTRIPGLGPASAGFQPSPEYIRIRRVLNILAGILFLTGLYFVLF